ncbi:MAG TPA: hypothetical protein VKP30_03830, partial [Polyangiaceae bacterium]|nr:hypothetical protein [Polyangiaceae bacterium]
DRDCDLIPGKHVCDAGECVQCTDINYSECGKLNGQSLVCDSVNRRCALDKTVGSGSACTPCVSDAQCRAGQLCAEQLFDNASVGRFCFWKEGDTANGAPATCASEAARPFIEPVSVKRIDGTSATLCGLRASTCVALERYKTSCAYEGKPGPGLCGFSAPRDATCGGDALGKFVCRVSCMSDNDCPANDSGSGGICDWESTRPTCLPPP